MRQPPVTRVAHGPLLRMTQLELSLDGGLLNLGLRSMRCVDRHSQPLYHLFLDGRATCRKVSTSFGIHGRWWRRMFFSVHTPGAVEVVDAPPLSHGAASPFHWTTVRRPAG